MALSKLKLRPIYKNVLIALEVLTSPPSITYFLIIVSLSGLIFYAAYPYGLIRRLLYAIAFGSLIAGLIFSLTIFSFSWLFFAFLTVSIFPFMVLVALSALRSLRPAFRFRVESDVDLGSPF
jgi:hypothetical protein